MGYLTAYILSDKNDGISYHIDGLGTVSLTAGSETGQRGKPFNSYTLG